MTHQRWEYTTSTAKYDNYGEIGQTRIPGGVVPTLDGHLQVMGDNGWELVGIPTFGAHITLFWKRPAPADTTT